MAEEKVVIEIDVDSSEVKEASSNIDKMGKSADKTKDSLGQMNEGAKKFGSSLKNLDFKGAIEGFNAMTKGALAFIATPIGAVIAAVGAAIGALTAYFKGSQEGQDRFNKLATIGSAIIGKFGDVVQAVGKFIFDTFAKGFEYANKFLSLIPGFDALTESVSKFLNLDNAESISNLEKQRRELTLQLTTRQALLRAEIEEAKLRAESTKNVNEKSAALAEAVAKTKELFANEKKLAELERDIAIEQGELANNTYEDNLKIEEAKARVNQVDREQSAALKELSTKQLAVNEQLNKERQAEIELRERIQRHQQSNIELTQRETGVELAKIDSIQKLGKISNTVFQQTIKQAKTEETERKKQAQIHKELEQQKLDATANTLTIASGLFKQSSATYKILASTRAAIDTYRAANLALASSPPPINFIQAGVVTAAGLLNVKKILSDGGGSSSTSIADAVIPAGNNAPSVLSSAGLQANANAGGFVANQNTQAIDQQIAVANQQPASVKLDYSEFTRFEDKISRKVALTEA